MNLCHRLPRPHLPPALRPVQAQLQRWQAVGLLTPEQAAQILAYEQASATGAARRQWGLTLSALGALVLGLGIIALVAANWGSISGGLKIAGLTTLMLSSYTLGYRLRDADGAGWPGTGAAFYLLGGVLFGALLGLLAQGMQLDVSIGTLLMLWGAGLLALAYAVRLPAALHLALPLGAVLPLLDLYGGTLYGWGGGGLLPLWVMLLISLLFAGVAVWHDQSSRSPALHALGSPWAFWFPPLLLGSATALMYHGLAASLGTGTPDSPALEQGILLVQVLAGLLALGVAYLGGRMERRAVIHWGLLGVAAAVLGLYFSLFARLLNIALVLIGAGLLLLGVGYLLERARRRLSWGLA
ncbi:DUF2157 domain-containing protein [Deinococcus lacus]|uniref:DUF2157 domain-containing protein n=1 Tax=Deinococcus lacus TaxID=392561 RepID=A0ABW1YFQ4_9DEIO